MNELIEKKFIKELNTEVYFNKTEKFKTASIQIMYTFPKGEVDIKALNILAVLLADACKDYPSTPALSSYLEELYGSSIAPKVSVSGDSVNFSIISSFISDIYSEKGLSDKIVELMSKIIYRPYFNNKKFDKDYFEFEKKKYIAGVQKAMERKETFAAMRFSEILEKEFNVTASLTHPSKLEKITLNKVMDAYNKLTSSSYRVLVIGDLDIEDVTASLIKYLPTTTPATNYNLVTSIDREIKAKVEKNEKFSQSYLIALYNVDTNILSDEKEHFSALVYSLLLHDRFFDVVREKNGLCYAIGNSYLNNNSVFRVSAGIDASKYRKTMSLVNKEINKVKLGKINNKDWNKTIELVTGLLANNQDDVGSCLRDLESYALRSKYISTPRAIEIIKNITKEDVIKIANKTRFITSFLLKGTGTAGGEQDA